MDKHFEAVGTIEEKSKMAKSNFKKFLDIHSLKEFDEETLRKLQESPKNEFGITHINMMYNKEKDKIFCLLDAPNREAVENHHNKHSVKCEWIIEMKTTT